MERVKRTMKKSDEKKQTFLISKRFEKNQPSSKSKTSNNDINETIAQ